MKAIENITAMKHVKNPRSKLPVIAKPKTTIAIAIMAETTSKAFFTLLSLSTREVRYIEAPAKTKVAPIITVTMFPDATPLKSRRKLSTPQINNCGKFGNFLKSLDHLK